MSAARRLVAVVRGRVQGVGFRATTASEGRRLGLRGVVRNRFDGCVSVEAEGGEPELAALEAFLHRGPSMARVDAVDVEWQAARGDLPPFDIGPTTS